MTAACVNRHAGTGAAGRSLPALLLVCVLLAGCAIITKAPEQEPGIDNPAAWQQRKKKLQSLQTWSMQGRVATGQLLGWTGDLSWRQRDERFDVRLSGPLGAGGFYAFGTLEHVTIRTSKEEIETTHPQQLVKEILEWDFPLQPLRYWAKGLPAPTHYDSISVDEDGRLRELEQNGWRVSYLEYAQQKGQPALPRRIIMDNGEVRIRLIVTRWFNLDRQETSRN